MASLFDDFERTDTTPARHQEGNFAFLNRIATPWWSEVRDRLEAWFQAYRGDADAKKTADLRGRFRSSDERQHLGAWWELYVYWLLRSLQVGDWLGVEPEHPERPTRPDFCVAPHAAARPELWVEAVTTFSGIVQVERHGAREAYVLDAINAVTSPDFRVSIQFRTVGRTHPRKRDIVEPLRAWLQTLNRDEVASAWQRGERPPPKVLTSQGWEIVLEPIPKGTRGRHPNDRLIGIGPMTVGFVNDVAQARKAIVRKAGHYKDLAAPFVIAVMPSSPTFDADDAVASLYGSEAVQFDTGRMDDEGRVVRLRDGAWSGGEGRVSGVLFGPGLFPWTVARVWPQLWLNPHAAYPLDSQFAPLPRVEVTPEGHLRPVDPDEPPARLLGLDPEWPGSGDPFAT